LQILQEDATESENKWPKGKRLKRGTLEYAQRREFNKIKNRMAAARSHEKVQVKVPYMYNQFSQTTIAVISVGEAGSQVFATNFVW